MPTIPLPERPNLDRLRGQARDVQRGVRRGDAAALALVAEHHPDGAPPEADRPGFRLASAQVTIARRYGFASWPRLARHVELVTELTRVPSAAPTGDPVDDFLRAACLTYSGGDGPERWAEARRILHTHPELVTRSVQAAAAASDEVSVRSHLAVDPGAATRSGGPHRWPPILYLAYSRLDPTVSESVTLTVARLLLEAGADPNSGFLHSGLPSPFTILTGVLGEGEQGPRACPRHPHWVALATVLLEAGADPNDSQGLYNRMFEHDDSHLELLFAHGLGRGDGGPWKARLGPALDPPDGLLRYQLGWAVTRNFPERVRLLVEHGVDPSTVFEDGRTAVERAALAGNREIVSFLTSAGAAPPELRAPEALVAAASMADEAAVARLVDRVPGVVEAAIAARPLAVLDAVAAGNPDGIEALTALGFDVNARAMPGQGYPRGATALHRAAGDGSTALVQRLLRLGADPEARDREWNSTPRGWAEHLGHPETAAVLPPPTDDGSSG